MEQSILKSTKKILGVGDDDTSFDFDIITHINTAFSNLNDLGVGPAGGFSISDAVPVWDDFVEDKVIQAKVILVVVLRVRALFDPPSTGYLNDALHNQIKEAEWRLNVNREEIEWSESESDLSSGVPSIIDGGNPDSVSPHVSDG